MSILRIPQPLAGEPPDFVTVLCLSLRAPKRDAAGAWLLPRPVCLPECRLAVWQIRSLRARATPDRYTNRAAEESCQRP